jgi:hypothetical protein
MVRLPAGNGPSIRLCARAWWISVLSSVQVNRFTCASRKVLYCGAAKGFDLFGQAVNALVQPAPVAGQLLDSLQHARRQDVRAGGEDDR